MLKTLVVDDEESIREALREFLEGEGDYEVLFAEDGHKALEIFKANPVDLVFLDIKMPGLDGIEVFRQMKQIKPEIKVVIITGLPDEQTFDRALAVSEEAVEGFIAKPFKPADLRKCLRIVLAGDHHAAFQLTPTQMEALGNFATTAIKTVSKALSEIIQKDTKITLQSINVIPLSQISKPLEEPGVSSVGLATRFSGTISGTVLFLVSWKGGLALIDLIREVPPGTTNAFDEADQSSLKSLGTILVGTYLKIFSDQINLPAQPGLPELAFENRNFLVKSIAKELAPSWETGEEYLFTIETELRIVDPSINCWFLLIPATDSLKLILRALGALR